jgi:hypothetical protein
MPTLHFHFDPTVIQILSFWAKLGGQGIEVTYEIRVFLKGAQKEVFSSIFKKSL